MSFELIERDGSHSRYRTRTGAEIRVMDVALLDPDPDQLDIDALFDAFARAAGWLPGDFTDYMRLLGATREGDAVGFCDHCGRARWQAELDDSGATTLAGERICESCRYGEFSFCEACDGLYHYDDADEHDHDEGEDEYAYDGCCSSPQPVFRIRNDGAPPLANDTRVTVTLPAGEISAEGITAIRRYLEEEASIHYRKGDITGSGKLYDLSCQIEDRVGVQWQTRAGNFTKRLSAVAYKQHGLKLTVSQLSQVGVLAREHSKSVDMAVEVTRKLNLSSGAFYNEGSCWWGSYGESRCALKTSGGFALRSFAPVGGGVTGRAWVMPLRLSESGCLTPTFDTETPDAFVVFNGYGVLDGYTAPRIVAHMAGWTYKKIGFSCDPMYINANGYLVAPEEIAQRTSELYLEVRRHSDLYETEKERLGNVA